jgi:hypothetical protein
LAIGNNLAKYHEKLKDMMARGRLQVVSHSYFPL